MDVPTNPAPASPALPMPPSASERAISALTGRDSSPRRTRVSLAQILRSAQAKRDAVVSGDSANAPFPESSTSSPCKDASVPTAPTIGSYSEANPTSVALCAAELAPAMSAVSASVLDVAVAVSSHDAREPAARAAAPQPPVVPLPPPEVPPLRLDNLIGRAHVEEQASPVSLCGPPPPLPLLLQPATPGEGVSTPVAALPLSRSDAALPGAGEVANRGVTVGITVAMGPEEKTLASDAAPLERQRPTSDEGSSGEGSGSDRQSAESPWGVQPPPVSHLDRDQEKLVQVISGVVGPPAVPASAMPSLPEVLAAAPIEAAREALLAPMATELTTVLGLSNTTAPNASGTPRTDASLCEGATPRAIGTPRATVAPCVLVPAAMVEGTTARADPGEHTRVVPQEAVPVMAEPAKAVAGGVGSPRPPSMGLPHIAVLASAPSDATHGSASKKPFPSREGNASPHPGEPLPPTAAAAVVSGSSAQTVEAEASTPVGTTFVPAAVKLAEPTVVVAAASIAAPAVPAEPAGAKAAPAQKATTTADVNTPVPTPSPQPHPPSPSPARPPSPSPQRPPVSPPPARQPSPAPAQKAVEDAAQAKATEIAIEPPVSSPPTPAATASATAAEPAVPLPFRPPTPRQTSPAPGDAGLALDQPTCSGPPPSPPIPEAAYDWEEAWAWLLGEWAEWERSATCCAHPHVHSLHSWFDTAEGRQQLVMWGRSVGVATLPQVVQHDGNTSDIVELEVAPAVVLDADCADIDKKAQNGSRAGPAAPPPAPRPTRRQARDRHAQACRTQVCTECYA